LNYYKKKRVNNYKKIYLNFYENKGNVSKNNNISFFYLKKFNKVNLNGFFFFRNFPINYFFFKSDKGLNFPNRLIFFNSYVFKTLYYPTVTSIDKFKKNYIFLPFSLVSYNLFDLFFHRKL
jgi:hypothetical protein